MSDDPHREAAEMLTVAAVTYNGFMLPAYLPRNVRRERLHRTMQTSLDQLPPTRNHWDIVWGPADFRAPLTLFDDAAMFVARHREASARFVIAIRGTNPVSPYDWLFGDFAVERTLTWPYGPDVGDARVSFSSYHGLRILQSIRCKPEPDSIVARFWNELDRRVGGPLRRAGNAFLDRLPLELGGPLRGPREALGRIISDFRSVRETSTPRSVEEWLEDVQSGPLSRLRQEALHHIDGITDGLRDRGPIDPLPLILGGAELRAHSESGESLDEFLARTVRATDGPVRIDVTGHSKGGALGFVLAQWLADTQGERAQEMSWDPEGRAALHVWSFAGPTPGNGAFARRVGETVGDRSHRIWNRLDLVPRAWDVDLLADIPDLYDLEPKDHQVLQDLASHIIENVREHDYRHVPAADTVHFEGGRQQRGFLLEAVYQHLQAYLTHAELGDEIGVETFFRLTE